MSSKHMTHDEVGKTELTDGVELTSEERRRQRIRNIAIGVVLSSLFVLFYVLTIARLGANVLSRPF